MLSKMKRLTPIQQQTKRMGYNHRLSRDIIKRGQRLPIDTLISVQPSTLNNAFPILPPTTTKTFTQLQLQQSDDQLNKNLNIKMMMNEEMVFLDHELELARAEMSHDEENEK